MALGKFHINSNGDIMPCKATKFRCQFGDESLHFTDEKEARDFVEKLYSEGVYGAVLRGKKSNAGELRKQVNSIVELRQLLRTGELPEKVEISGKDYKVLKDRSKSGFICSSCGEQLSKALEETILSWESGRCSCGAHTKGPENQPIGVFAESLWILNPDLHPEKKLYHSTKRANWSEEIKKSPELKIHLGTARAADVRRNDRILHDALDGVGKKGWRRYSVKLKPREHMKILLSEDLYESWSKIGADGDYVAYLNRWEDPGALSLMTTQDFLEIEPKSKLYSLKE